MKKGYSRSALLALGPQRVYSGRNLDLISFPLGGIGTGSVGLSGQGGLIDWEVFNRPNVGGRFPRTFPLIWAREKDKDPVCRVLEAPAPPPYQGSGGGDPHGSGEGLPRMDGCTFRGEYPFAWIQFECAKLPVAVQLEAYNPFIPSNPDDSGFPAAILRYTLMNRTRKPVEATVAWSLLNAIGSIGRAEQDPALRNVEFGFGKNVNTRIEKGGLSGLVFSSEKWGKDHPRFGSMALVTPDAPVTVLEHWLREGWFTPMHDFWDTFSATGRFPERHYGPSPEGQTEAGALGIRAKLERGQSKTLTFYLTWHFPNFEKCWGDAPCCGDSGAQGTPKRATWRNYYATRFHSALDAAVKLHQKERTLRAHSMQFHDALFSTTAPPHVLDAVSSQMAILKTATCLRLGDGTFYGFEGCGTAMGCCEGSCTHVWNYQQALAFLFPSLERSMRSADYRYNLRPDGSMCFRLQLPLGSPPNDFHAAADGQMGGIIKAYRDWKISGDDKWLRKLWPSVQRALDFAWAQWDRNRDGVMDGIQHNTYDIEFRGANPLTTIFYLAALKAGAELADHFGERLKAAEYRHVCAKGRAWVDANLFNGEYYVQRYDPKEAPQFQFGEGCLADQLLGQQLASLAGLGYVLDPRHIRTALKAIFGHNWRETLSDHANAQRVYALNDEAGLVLCAWPRGGRPAVPFPYSDEVWTGIEYQVAAHLMIEGMAAEAMAIVMGARDRHDGHRRNPWNEFECGNHYARAMSSYGLLPAISGFTYDKGAGRIGFNPRICPKDFKTFWALDNAWGTYSQKGNRAALEVLYGSLTLNCLDLPGFAKGKRTVRLKSPRRTSVEVLNRDGGIQFAQPLSLTAGQTLTIGARA